ncbi:GNAT family N-acetyltransferase [Verrucomicrobia bacterium]|nr:GNAT family N-acetyltransferase [Verrucomicrobiota bacterium]
MNVTLRAPEKTDFSMLAALRNDAAVQRQLMIEPRQYSPAQVRAWIRRRTGDVKGAFWVIDRGGPCGFVQLTQVDRERGTADLGICLVRAVRGKGVAAEAMGLLEAHAKEKLRCKTLTLRVLSVNHRAIALYGKLKFRILEAKRRHHFDGAHWRDVVFMEKALR